MDDQASELPDLAGKGGSSLLRAMLALSAPGLDEAKATFRKELDEVLGGARSDNLNARARKLGLSPALQQKLALEVLTPTHRQQRAPSPCPSHATPSQPYRHTALLTHPVFIPPPL